MGICAQAVSVARVAPEPSTSTAPNVGTHRLLIGLLAVAALGVGLLVRDEEYLSPEYGIGYCLGILGALMMLSLMLYTLRKNMEFMRSWGSVKSWFIMHQVLGCVGPLCILFHANLRLGSTNSNVALACMLVVVASGLVGRFLHGKIRHGQYERRTRFRELKHRWEEPTGDARRVLAMSEGIRRRLEAFDAGAVGPTRGGTHALWLAVALGLRRRWTYLLALWEFRSGVRRARAEGLYNGRAEPVPVATAKHFLWEHLSVALAVAQFNMYERLFALWHALHIPLFFMLLLSSVVHVIAVHGF